MPETERPNIAFLVTTILAIEQLIMKLKVITTQHVNHNNQLKGIFVKIVQEIA